MGRETAAAAAFAVGVRLVTGAIGLMNVLVVSLFPRLARTRQSFRLAALDDRAVALAGKVILGLGAIATAVLLALPALFIDVFLNRDDAEAEATAILILSGGAVAGASQLLTMIFVVSHVESRAVSAYAAATLITLCGGVATVLLAGDRHAVLVAGSLTLGLVAGAAILTHRVSRLLQASRSTLRAVTATGAAVAGVGAISALVPEVRAPVAVALTVLGLTCWIDAVREWRRPFLGEPTVR